MATLFRHTFTMESASAGWNGTFSALGKRSSHFRGSHGRRGMWMSGKLMDIPKRSQSFEAPSGSSSGQRFSDGTPHTRQELPPPRRRRRELRASLAEWILRKLRISILGTFPYTRYDQHIERPENSGKPRATSSPFRRRGAGNISHPPSKASRIPGPPGTTAGTRSLGNLSGHLDSGS